MTFGEKILAFIKRLEFTDQLPSGINIMNPYREDPRVMPVVEKFYKKYYNDNFMRHLILGINPGRFGAGSTGIPFTDTKRLQEKCGLEISGVKTFEPSSAFIYEMIDNYGGPEKFYSGFYISAVSPLGFTREGAGGKQVNYNYYDSRTLEKSIIDFVKMTLEQQLDFGIYRDVCFCLGIGQNYKFIDDFNRKYRYFEKVVPLEHPRFIMQYKTKQKQLYIRKYLDEFGKVMDRFV
jgi:hypothetical protein